MNKQIVTVGNWEDKVPREVLDRILEYLFGSRQFQAGNYKNLRQVNATFNSIVTPIFLRAYAINLKGIIANRKLQTSEGIEKLDGVLQKVKEKQSAVDTLLNLKSALNQNEFVQILKGTACLTSELRIVQSVAKEVKDHMDKIKQREQQYLQQRGEYWDPPGRSGLIVPPGNGFDVPDFRRDMEPLGGRAPFLPHIDRGGVGGGPGSLGPFGPGGAPHGGGVWGDPDNDHERVIGGGGGLGPFAGGAPRNPTSPFGTGLPPANPFNPRGGFGSGGGFNPRFL